MTTKPPAEACLTNTPTSSAPPVIDLDDSCRAATVLAIIVLITGREAAPLAWIDDKGTPVYSTHIDHVEITIRPANQMVQITAPGLAPRFIMTGPTGEISGAQYDCLVTGLRRAGLDVPEPTQLTMPRFARRQIFQAPNYDGNGLLPPGPPTLDATCRNLGCLIRGTGLIVPSQGSSKTLRDQGKPQR